MYAQGRIKARRRKNAEALYNAEILSRDELHADCADEHHCKRYTGANAV